MLTKPFVGELFFVAVLALLIPAAPAEAAPQRAWAHEQGVANLQPNRPHEHKLSAEDLVAIHELFSRWGIGYDEGRLAVIGSLFTQDAEFVVLKGSAIPLSTHSGTDDILATLRSTMAEQGDQRRHLITNVVIEPVDENRATALAYGLVIAHGESMFIGATVIYSADVVRQDGVWKFSRYVIGMDDYAGTPPSEKPLDSGE